MSFIKHKGHFIKDNIYHVLKNYLLNKKVHKAHKDIKIILNFH